MNSKACLTFSKVFTLSAFLIVSGCTTFQCNELPKQFGKPQGNGARFFITENAQIRNECITPLSTCLAPYLKQAINEMGNHVVIEPPNLTIYVTKLVTEFQKLPKDEKCRMCGLGVRTTTSSITTGGKLHFKSDYDPGSAIGWADTQLDSIYRANIRADAIQRMRRDSDFRHEMLSPGVFWIDCSSDVAAIRHDLYNILAGCSLLTIPAIVAMETKVDVILFDEDGCRANHSYKDSYSIVGWIPFFPLMLFEDQPREWGNQPRGAPVKLRMNMAAATVNDLAIDLKTVPKK